VKVTDSNRIIPREGHRQQFAVIKNLNAFLEMGRLLSESGAGSPHDRKPAVTDFRRKTNRIYDKRIPFPAADRVPVPVGM
jgi:hypothetical protein